MASLGSAVNAPFCPQLEETELVDLVSAELGPRIELRLPVGKDCFRCAVCALEKYHLQGELCSQIFVITKMSRWSLETVKSIAARRGGLRVLWTRAAAFFDSREAAAVAARSMIANLTIGNFAETIVQGPRHL